MRGKTHEKHHASHMSEHRPHKAGGGKVAKAGGNPFVEEEADEKKRGGKVKRKHGGKIEGKAAHHHLGRPGRKRGGKVGADLSPLSSASKPSEVGHQAATQSGPMSRE